MYLLVKINDLHLKSWELTETGDSSNFVHTVLFKTTG